MTRMNDPVLELDSLDLQVEYIPATLPRRSAARWTVGYTSPHNYEERKDYT